MSFEIPTLRIGDFADVKGGKRMPAGTALTSKKTSHPYLRIVDFKDGAIDASDLLYVPESVFPQISRYVISSEDIYISIVGTVGLVGSVPISLNGANLTENAAKICSIDSAKVNSRYLTYYLRSEAGQRAINSLTVGSTQPKLALFRIEQIEIPVPSLNVQHEIAATLGALDDRITLLRETNATLEAIAQALFKSWFVDFDPVRAKMEGRVPEGMDEATAALFPDALEETELGVVPRAWRETTLANLISQSGGSIQTGPFGSQLHASDYVENGVPVVMPKDISHRRVQTDSIARVPPTDADRLARHKLAPGDVLFSRRGDVERHALISETERGWLSGTGCLLVRSGNQWPSPNFLSLLLDAPQSRTWLVQHAVGATMPNLNTGILGSVPVVIPSTDLLLAFENIVSALEARRAQNSDTAQTLSTLRDTLLPRLISGQLRVAEAQTAVEKNFA